MNSIAARLSLAASLVLAAFVVTTAFALQTSVHERAEQAQYDRLQGLVYGVLGAADVQADGSVQVNVATLPDQRLQQLNSGLIATILSADHGVVWRSASLLGNLPELPLANVDEWQWLRLAHNGTPQFAMLYGIEWIDVAGRSNQYTFAVISDRRSYDEQLASFDQQLWLLLGAFSVLLLGAQIAVLRWGLAPLRKLARQIRAIEGGEAARIEGPLHRELRPLGDGLNALLQHEQGQQQRYRNALDDLAHSLKTPLAVLRNLGDDAQIPEEPRKLLREHGQRMEQIVGYQLQRAATRGQRALAPPVALAPVLARLARTLEKVFAGKQIQIELEIPEEAALRIDEGDLMELCGNLMENACKYGRSHVRVSAQRNAAQLTLTIEDDGPGFPPDAQQLITRGTRADTRTDGQGIGLAVAAEIAASYTAEMRLQASEALGGASVCLRFVGASGQ